MSDNNIHEVVIVGSGPAGYTAGIYAARAGLKPVIVAGSVTAGGALVNTTEVENFPGFPGGVMGPELMDKMEEQAREHGAEIIFDDAISLSVSDDVKEIVLADGETLYSRTVILALGAQHRHLGVPGEVKLGGRGVSYCGVCDAPFFRGKKVIVVGGGDSALEEATFLAKFASEVTLVHRRDELRASKAMQGRFFNTENCKVRWNSEVASFNGDTNMSSVTLRDSVSGLKETIEVDGAFIAVGHDPRSALVKSEVATDSDGYVLTLGKTTRVLNRADAFGTEVSGVFACGDLVDRTYRQAITAAGSGCAAALDAQRYLEELV